MNKQTLLQWLNNIGLEQLFGIAVGSSVLCLCCLLINRLLRTRSASFQSCVWHATCGALVLSGMVLSAVPGIPFRPTADVAEDSLHVGSRAVAVLPQLPPSQPAVWDLPATESSGDVPHHSGSWPVKTLETVGLPAVQRSSSAVSPTVESADALTVDPQEWSVNIPALLAGIWLSVAAILLAAFVRSILVCRAIVRRSSRRIPEDMQAIASRVSERLNASVIPQLMLCDDLKIPFTAGVIRPVIVLPGGSTQWPTQKLEMVIAHELAHVQRRDVLWHWIGRLAVILAWFNPLVWLTAGRGVLNREQACDDRVIGAGFEGTQYGECLVEIAAAVSGRILPATAAVSMAEPPLKQRLQNVLSPSVNRARETRAVRGLVIATFFILATFIGIIRPFATAPAADKEEATQQSAAFEQDSAKAATPQTSNAKDSDDALTAAENDSGKKPNKEAASGKPKTEELIELTKPVVGTVTDEDGNPIAFAKVVVKLKHFDTKRPGINRLFTKRVWQTTTDEEGRYSVDVSNLGPQPSHFSFGAESVDKAGFAQGKSPYWPSLKDVTAGQEIRVVKLQKGRRITGQVVSDSGQPAGGFVRATAVKDDGSTWSSSGTSIAADGKLVVDIPLNSKATFVVYCEDHAPKLVSLDAGESDLGQIHLSGGTRVSGQVVDLKDRPVPGVVVVLDFDDLTLRHVITGWSRVALTDAEGKFSLSPAAGDCTLCVQRDGFPTDWMGGEGPVVGNTPPVIAPVALSLAEKRGVHNVVLQEAETHRVTGTARWEDGSAAANFAIEGYVVFDGVTEKLQTAVTDERGNYEFRLPRDMKIVLSGSGGAFRDAERNTWCRGYAAAVEAPAVAERTYINVEKLDGDIANANWELRAYRESPPRTKAQKDAKREFTKLQTEDGTLDRDLRGRDRSNGRGIESQSVMAEKYLAFEEAYRGEKEAMQAIVHVLRSRNRPSDIEISVQKARIEMVERLIKHYLGHEDLDDAFSGLRSGLHIPRADDLLRFAYGRSPHPTIRAAALFARAEHAKRQLRDLPRLTEMERYAAAMDDPSTFHPSNESQESVKLQAESMRREVAELKAIKPAELSRQAVDWLNIIEKDYGDLERPHMLGHTFGQDAKALRFAIEHVNVGQPAPPFEAIDINAKPFRLGDELGKVVVITFNQSLHNKADNLPHQELIDIFRKQTFELVTIVATGSKEAFVKNAKMANIKGTVIWEPLRGPYQSNWGVTQRREEFYAAVFFVICLSFSRSSGSMGRTWGGLIFFFFFSETFG